MKFLDLSLPTPEENLALDEVLLNEAEAGLGNEVIRFWESSRYFVVLGAGSPSARDADLTACRAAAIPVLRRCSGGGTVLQGPGCLNYAFILDQSFRPEIKTIAGTNQYVLGQVARALNQAGQDVECVGISDLVIKGMKISGNAQRRRRSYVLFHGTVLYGFDLPLISRYLKEPERQPDYRAHRPHDQFVQNLELNSRDFKNSFKRSMREIWQCDGSLDADYTRQITDLITAKYSRDDWNLSF